MEFRLSLESKKLTGFFVDDDHYIFLPFGAPFSQGYCLKAMVLG